MRKLAARKEKGVAACVRKVAITLRVMSCARSKQRRVLSQTKRIQLAIRNAHHAERDGYFPDAKSGRRSTTCVGYFFSSAFTASAAPFLKAYTTPSSAPKMIQSPATAGELRTGAPIS